MTNHRNRFPGRRKFLKQSAALSAGAATLATPSLIAQTLAEPAAVEGGAMIDSVPARVPTPSDREPRPDNLRRPGS